MPEERVRTILSEEGIDLTVILPCDRTKELCSLLETYSQTITVMREEDAVGLCAGLCLAGKNRWCIFRARVWETCSTQ
jgi:sulfopyruvate decarboxylase